MAIQYNQQNKLFQVDYQSPFGGIDSTAYASAIDPHNLVSNQASFIEDNIIKPIALKALGNPTISGDYMGFIPYTGNTQGSSGGWVITDTFVYPAEITFDGTNYNLSLTAGIPYAPTKIAGDGYFHYIVINDIQTGVPTIYWTGFEWTEIWSFDSATSVTALTTAYCGGGILGLLNNQLMNLGGWSAADGDTPNRISWSAPGQYGQFQPYDVTSGTGNYAAGFNDLPSTSDVLTGFAAIGTVGYLFRTEGITQVNPTGNGIQPFQFNHLWASDLGIGCPYPYSVSQYGSLVAFLTDGGAYTLSLAGLAKMGKNAQTYIYKYLNSVSPSNSLGISTYAIKAQIVPYLLDSPSLYYVLAIPSDTGGLFWNFIAISLDTDAVYNLGTVSNNVGGYLACQPSYFLNAIPFQTDGTQGRKIVPLLMFFLSTAPTQISPFYFVNDPTKIGQMTFRKEQMKFGFVPTPTKVAFLASLIDTAVNGTISISIDGGLNYGTRVGPSGESLGFPDITIVAGVAPGGDGVIDNVYSDAVVSIQRPQLAIKLTNVQIAEVWYQGTLANYDLI